MTKIKICGLTRACDVEKALSLGADYLGFILSDVSPRFIDQQQLEKIIKNVPKHIQKVGVFVNEIPEMINRFSSLIDIAQLHGNEPPEIINKIQLSCWKAITIETKNVQEYKVEALLVDAIKGEKITHAHWTLAKQLRDKGKVFLAGGISIKNIKQALNEVKPFGIDLSSSIELEAGIKSNQKMNEFFKIIGELK